MNTTLAEIANSVLVSRDGYTGVILLLGFFLACTLIFGFLAIVRGMQLIEVREDLRRCREEAIRDRQQFLMDDMLRDPANDAEEA